MRRVLEVLCVMATASAMIADPGTAQALTLMGVPHSGIAGQPYSEPITVRLTADDGNAMNEAGVRVSLRLLSATGDALLGEETTNREGLATFGQITWPAQPGQYVLLVSAFRFGDARSAQITVSDSSGETSGTGGADGGGDGAGGGDIPGSGSSGNDGNRRITAILGFQADGSSGVRRLAPQVFLGFDEHLVDQFHIRGGPTISSSNVSTASDQKLLALMVPGNLNLGLSVYRRVTSEDKPVDMTIIASASAKFVGGLSEPAADDEDQKESGSDLVQLNTSLGVGFKIQDALSLTYRYYWARHDLTNASLSTFEESFVQSNHSIQYFEVTAAFRLTKSVATGVSGQSNSPVYFFANWAKFRNPSRFGGLAAHDRVLTLGIRADQSLAGTLAGEVGALLPGN